MKSKIDFSDEAINAYVDDELTSQERLDLLEAASFSDELRRRICEVSQIKASVQQAYPLSGKRETHETRFMLTRYQMAASFVLLALFAWLLLPATSTNDSIKLLALDQATSTDITRVVFHISTDDATSASGLMDQVQLVLQQYQKEGRALKVHVVANNAGLRNLQQGRSTIADRLQQLDQQYDNVVFAACGNTINRFHQQKGEEISILPSAVIIQSGVSYVARRQSEGWVYIKV